MKFLCTSGKGIWIQQGKTSLSGNQGRIFGIAVDPVDQSVVAVGSFRGTFDFSQSLNQPISSASGSFDILIAKFSSDGTLLWTQGIGNTWDDVANAVVIDGSSNIFVTGAYGSTVDFGNGHSLTCVTPVFGIQPDIFVAKYNASGVCQWATSLGGDNGDTGFGIRLDGAGNVYVVGNCSSSNTSFVSSSAPVTLTGSGTLFMAKLSPSGVTQWCARYGGPNAITPRGLALTSSGDMVVCGQTISSPDLGGGTRTNQGLFLAKYSGIDGSYIFDNVVGSGTTNSIAINPTTQDIFITGQFNGQLDFGGGNFIQDVGGGRNANGGIFIVQYGSSGNYIWGFTPNSVNFPYTGSDMGQGISIASDGSIIVSGQVISSVSFDGNSVWYGSGIQDLFTAVYTSGHVLTFADRASDNYASTGTCAASGTNIMAGGNFYGTASSPSTTLDGVGLSSIVNTVCPIVIEYLFQSAPPLLPPNPADFTAVYAPSADGTVFQTKFAFVWKGSLPAGVSNILVKYFFPTNNINPGPNAETTPFLLLNYRVAGLDSYFNLGPVYGTVYKVSGGNGALVNSGLGYYAIGSWYWTAAWADAAGNQISGWCSDGNTCHPGWVRVVKTMAQNPPDSCAFSSAAVFTKNDGNVVNTPYANLKTNTIRTLRGPMQVVS